MAKDIAIKVSNLSKNFKLPHERTLTLKSAALRALSFRQVSSETQHALRDIDFEVKKGEFFGIVGRNGSGKSTLLKILAGIYQPTHGHVQVTGKLVPFIELGVGFNGELTGRENVYLNGALLGFSQREVTAMYEGIVEFAELGDFMDQKLKNYSSGMQVRLAFSLATRAQADVLLVDEVLAVGDADFQRKCFKYFKQLKKSGTTVIFVSHDMSAVREYCDRAILIDDSHLTATGTADYIATAYTRLFLPKEQASTMDDTGKRWGSGEVKYTKVSVKNLPSEIIISATAIAQVDVEDPVFGFSLKSGSGQPLLGTNTKFKKLPPKSMNAGESIILEWSFPNILGDGTYSVVPAVCATDAVTIYDWWEDAAMFTVYKLDRSGYDVEPEITVNRTSA